MGFTLDQVRDVPEVAEAVAAADRLIEFSAVVGTGATETQPQTLGGLVGTGRAADVAAHIAIAERLADAGAEERASRAEWVARQHELNGWTHHYLRGVAPLVADGVPGHATRARIMGVKYYLGYGKDRDASYKPLFVRRLRHVHEGDWSKYFSKNMHETAARRRKAQRRAYLAHQVGAVITPGVTRYNGVPVCKCAVPILTWCHEHGWPGHLVSGYRTPAYSDSLCYRMCGHPACPGLCAGRNSNHSGNTCHRFAVDVSDYWTFRSVVARYNATHAGPAHIFNRLPRDPVHFSPSGN